MSQITLQANLAGDLELKQSRNGNSYCQLVLAQSTRYLDGEEWKETGTKFWRVMIYGKQAEYLCSCDLPKGTKLVIVGDLTVEDRPEWTDNSGVVHEATTEVSIRAKSVSVEISNWYDIRIAKHASNNASAPVAKPTAPVAKPTAPVRSTASKKATRATAPAPAVAEEEDIFGALDDDTSNSDEAVDLWG